MLLWACQVSRWATPALLKLGQQLHIFGYPAIGGETITYTSGDISGFTYEAGIQGRAWIKTSASISGGNSGGTAIDDQGNLIGVPTQSGSGSGSSPDLDCRPENDTNGDGVIDDKDVCVPIGGFINALRPVNLAKPLITQALNGIGPQPTSVPIFPTSILPQPSKTSLPGTTVPTTVHCNRTGRHSNTGRGTHAVPHHASKYRASKSLKGNYRQRGGR